MLERWVRKVFAKRMLLVDKGKEVVDKETLFRLRNDSHAYRRLLRRVEELKKDMYVPLDLDEFLPIDTQVEIPDHLPDDM